MALQLQIGSTPAAGASSGDCARRPTKPTRLRAVAMRTTCFRAGVLNSDERVHVRCFKSLLAAFIAGVSIGEECNSGLSSKLMKDGVYGLRYTVPRLVGKMKQVEKEICKNLPRR